MMLSRRAAQVVLLVVCLIWGANFTAMKILLNQMSPFSVVSLRTAVAAMGFLVVMMLLRRGIPAFTKQDWIRIVQLGVLGVTSYNIFSALGQDHLPAALSSLIIGSSPIFTALFAGLLGIERITRNTVIGLVLATTGLVLLVSQGRGVDVPLTREVVLAAAVLVVAPASWGAYTVLAKPMLRRHDPITVAGMGMIIGAVTLSPLFVVDPRVVPEIQALDRIGWAALTLSALGSLVVAYILFGMVLRALPPSQAAMTSYITPLFAITIAWLVLGEQPTLGLLLGGVFVLAAVLVISRAPRVIETEPSE